WTRVGGPLWRQQWQRAARPDHVWPHAGKFGRVKPNAISVAACPPVIDHHIAALPPAQLLQAAHECRFMKLCFRIVLTDRLEHADAPHALGLLRPRSKRPHCRAAEQRDELAAFHSISLVNADQSFCGDVSDGRTGPPKLQDASNRQTNDEESEDTTTARGQWPCGGKLGFANSGTEPSRRGWGPLLHQAPPHPAAYTRRCVLISNTQKEKIPRIPGKG